MIVDTDTHNYSIEIFEDFEVPNFYNIVKNTLDSTCDLDAAWQQIYNQVRDASWPDPGTVNDFAKLPEHIRHELKHQHQLGLAWVSDDLLTLHVDHQDHSYPSLQCQARSGPAFCKTSRQVINPETNRPMLDYSFSAEVATKLMRHYNQKMSALCDNNSALDFTLWLAMQDIDACMQELNRYRDRDFFAVILDDRLPWAMIPSAFPVFEFCANHGIPVYFHANISAPPVDCLAWDFENPRYQACKKQWPFQLIHTGEFEGWKVNAATLITEGMFERLPDLQVIFTEKGLHWVKGFREFMLSQNWPDPVPVFQKHFYFTAEPEEPGFIDKAAWIGWNRLLFATDYPHDDPGGKHRFKDVDLLQSWKEQGIITEHQYNLITHENYQKLKARK